MHPGMIPLVDLIEQDVMEALSFEARQSHEETDKLRGAILEQIRSPASSPEPERQLWLAAQDGPRQLYAQLHWPLLRASVEISDYVDFDVSLGLRRAARPSQPSNAPIVMLTEAGLLACRIPSTST
jgi:hypothetical protein